MFDKVPYNVLMNKLEGCGLDFRSVKWIRNWLDNCIQRAVVNGSLSDYMVAGCHWA